MANFSQDVVAKARDFDRDSAALKTRVHQLAKALGLTSKETIVALGHAGIVVKSAAATINRNQLDAVLNFISDSTEPASLVDEGSGSEPLTDEEVPQENVAEAAAVAADTPTPSGSRRGRRVRRAVRSAGAGAAATGEAGEASAEESSAEEAKTEAQADSSTTDTQVAEDATTEAAVAQAHLEIAADSHVDQPTGLESDAFEPATGEALADIEPPATPEPPVAEEQTAYAPLFLAPQAVVVEDADDSPDGSGDDHDGDYDHDSDAGAAAEVAEDASGYGPQESSESDSGLISERQPRPRRRRRGRGRRAEETQHAQDDEGTQDNAETPAEIDEPQAIEGSTRLEAQRRRRIERREESQKRHVISEAEFLARRESVERTMVVRERARHDHAGVVTEVGVLEDDLLVEHFVTSDTQTTQIGNIYLGRVQNVLPSMEAAFIDIGTDRNGVIYVGDLNWKLMGSKARSRKIDHVLKSGDQILVQVSKDPIGHKGARLTTHISLAGRFLVYVPGGHSAGISRKLPEPERKRLKAILSEVTPKDSGTIIRTAAEGVSKEAIEADIQRLQAQWEDIRQAAEAAKAKRGAKPITLYQEPDMLVKVVRDVFNEDFSRLVVEGDKPWNTVTDYIGDLAPELEPRLQRYFASEHGGADVFEHFRIDEQLAKALDRKVWLPSGGTLIIDHTEAMTVIDVNTGKFTGAGGNLEETVTRNNLEAAEEIVRQMRLRDLGGMIVVDFIDMVLPENQDLVLRRLKEALGRDRSRHEVSEVTSLGLVQMTRKRLGTGLLETFSTPCECCNGRGFIIHIDPVEHDAGGSRSEKPARKRRAKSHQEHDPAKHPAAVAMRRHHGQEAGFGASEEQLDDAWVRSEQEQTDADRRVAAAVEAVIVSSESDEPRPPRRRRTRATRSGRAEQSGQARQSSQVGGSRSSARELAQGPDGNGRGSRNGRRGRADRAEHVDHLAAVAAAAVAEAREADPEEPSDDRYAATPPTSRRRRRATRRRVAEHVAVDTAARVVSDADSRDEFDGAESQGARDGRDSRDAHSVDRSGVSASSRRRRRRAARRVRESQAGTQIQGERIAQRESASQPKPVVTQTYEEARAAFEASPRRRRPTRGNSRSDHAPRREDFDTEKIEAKKIEAAGSEVSQQRRQDGRGEAQIVAVHGTGARRNRRRAVRRLASESGASASELRQTASAARPRGSQKSELTAPAASKQSAANPRRRVRRAVHKTRR